MQLKCALETKMSRNKSSGTKVQLQCSFGTIGASVPEFKEMVTITYLKNNTKSAKEMYKHHSYVVDASYKASAIE